MTKAELEKAFRISEGFNKDLRRRVNELENPPATQIETYKQARLRLEQETGEIHNFHEARRKEIREKFVAHIMGCGYSTFVDALHHLPIGTNHISILNDLGDRAFYCFFEDKL